MAGRGVSSNDPSADEVAAYVASMARELKVMAVRHDLSVLAYLLDLVRMEAEARAEGQGFGGGIAPEIGKA
jgi:hypothetical protein